MQKAWLIGADDACDIQVDSPVVSRRHCRLFLDDAGWGIEDLGSTNGTFVNGERLAALRRIAPTDAVTLGRSVPLPWPADALPGRHHALPTLPLPASGRRIVLGRARSCDVVLDEPMVSSRHASIEHTGEGWTLRDLGSTNGTFVRGRRISQPAPITMGDEIGFGSHRVVLASPDIAPGGHARGGGATIEVRNLAVEAEGHRLIERVALVIRPGELVGVMGPSGAGKSTLLAALSGSQLPHEGRVTVDGIDVVQRFDELRGHIGYVPQDDIMHAELTVRQALWYAGRLRLPRDYSRAEMNARVAAVLDQLGLADVADVRIGTPDRRGISGGQRKRVNVALELITDPPVLLLDEPTSGLSSTDALSLMKLLRGLADRGKTVVLTIHQPGIAALRLMDALAVIARDISTENVGRLAWFGPPIPDAIAFFEPGNHRPDAEAVLRGLASASVAGWCEAFERTETKRAWVDRRLSAGGVASSPRPRQRRSLVDTVAQGSVLVRRMLAIKAAGRWSTGILLAQAPIIAALIAIVFGGTTREEVDHASWSSVSRAVATTTFLIALAAMWCGCSNAAREIVSERAIYRRERMVGMSLHAYVASKVTVLVGLCLIQCAALQAIVTSACALSASPSRVFVVLLLAAVNAVMIGLCISAAVRTPEAASGILPVIILPMVILGGILLPLPDMPGPTALLADAVPSRWAFEALLVPEAEARPHIEVPVDGASGDDATSRVIDMAEPWFPIDGGRSTPDTPIWMLLTSCLIGLVAVQTLMAQGDARNC